MDCVVHHHMNKITVFGTVCSILVNLGNDPRDCLVNMFPRKASVPGTVLCGTRQQSPRLFTTIFIRWCTTQSLALLSFFEACWANNSPSDHYQGLRECNIPSLRLLPYSYGGAQPSLWDCCRNLNHSDKTTVPKTVTIFIRWCITQSLGLLSSFESKWPNNRTPDCRHIHIWIRLQSWGLHVAFL